MNLAQLFVRVSADISGLQKNMSAAERAVDKLADRAGKLGQKLTLGVTAPLAALGALSVKTAASFDSLTKGLEAVAGSAGAAETQLARLREIAKLPSVDLRQATQASIAFQAIGKSAEFAERTIKGVANAVALSGGGASEFSGVLRQMRQIASMGKLMGEELNTILENAPAMAKALQNAFGTTSAEAIRSLNLSTEEFFERLQQGMESLPQVAGGAANSFDNFRSSVEQAAAVVGGQLLPAVIPLVDGFATMLEGMQTINPETVRLGIAFGAAAAAAGPLIGAVSSLTKAFLALRTVSLATVGLVGAGGALALGMAALVGWFVKTKLEAVAAAGGVKEFANEVASLSEQTARFRLNDVTDQILDLNEKLRGMSQYEEVTDVVDGITYTFKRLNPEFAATKAEIDRLNEQWRVLVRRVGDLQNPADAAGQAIQSGIVDPLTNVVTAADAAADALARLDARVGFRGFDHTLGDPSIIERTNINPRTGLPGPDLTPVAARGEKTASQAAEIEAVALAREAEREAIANLGVAIGSISKSAARGIQGVQAFAASIELLRKGQGGSGLSGLLNLASGAIGAVSAITQLGGLIFGQSQATRELTAALKSNTDRLRDLRLNASGFQVNQEAINKAAAAATAIAANGQLGYLLPQAGASIDRKLIESYLKSAGLSFDQFAAIMNDAGVQIMDSTGNLLFPAFKQAAEILGLFKEEVQKTTSSMTNVPSVFANALRRFQASTAGITGTATGTARPPLPQVPDSVNRDRPTLEINGPVTVVANDPAEFARQMEAYGQRVAMRQGYSNFALAGG